jgi:hypothetical protein
VGSLAGSCVSNVRDQLSSLLQSAVGSSAAAALQVLLPSDTHPSAQVSTGIQGCQVAAVTATFLKCGSFERMNGRENLWPSKWPRKVFTRQSGCNMDV